MADTASFLVDMERLSYSLVVLFDGTVGPASENEGVRGGLGRVADHVFGMFTLTPTSPFNLTHTHLRSGGMGESAPALMGSLPSLLCPSTHLHQPTRTCSPI